MYVGARSVSTVRASLDALGRPQVDRADSFGQNLPGAEEEEVETLCERRARLTARMAKAHAVAPRAASARNDAIDSAGGAISTRRASRRRGGLCRARPSAGNHQRAEQFFGTLYLRGYTLSCVDRDAGSQGTSSRPDLLASRLHEGGKG